MSIDSKARRKTYAQGRRDERAAMIRAMRPREVIVAEARFEHFQISGRPFSGRGKIEVHEDVFLGGFSGSLKIPGLRSWRVKMAPRNVSIEDREFMFDLTKTPQAVDLIFEPDGPNKCCGQALFVSMSLKGRNDWRFMGVGQLTMEQKKPAPGPTHLMQIPDPPTT